MTSKSVLPGSRSSRLEVATVVVAEKIPLLRKGLRVVLEERGNRVLAEAADGLEAVRQVEKHKPSVLIAGLLLPHLRGLEVLRHVRRFHPETHVILLGELGDANVITTAFQHGAQGAIDFASSLEDITQAVRDVNGGRRFLSSKETNSLLAHFRSPEKSDDPCGRLTPRERQVFQLAAEGMNRPQIARTLFISERTVETHRANLMHKLALHSQTDLVRFAIRKGIVPA